MSTSSYLFIMLTLHCMLSIVDLLDNHLKCLGSIFTILVDWRDIGAHIWWNTLMMPLHRSIITCFLNWFMVKLNLHNIILIRWRNIHNLSGCNDFGLQRDLLGLSGFGTLMSRNLQTFSQYTCFSIMHALFGLHCLLITT